MIAERRKIVNHIRLLFCPENALDAPLMA